MEDIQASILATDERLVRQGNMMRRFTRVTVKGSAKTRNLLFLWIGAYYRRVSKADPSRITSFQPARVAISL